MSGRGDTHARAFEGWGCMCPGCVYVILEGEGKVLGGFAGLYRRLTRALSKLLGQS